MAGQGALFAAVTCLALLRTATAACGNPKPGYDTICGAGEPFVGLNPSCQNGGVLCYDEWALVESEPNTVAMFNCRCDCPKVWAGTYCTEIGAVCTEKPCQNFGTCVAHNKCACPEGFAGDQCQNVVCARGCDSTNGYCNNPGECFCKDNTHASGAFCDGCQIGYWKDDADGQCKVEGIPGHCDSVDEAAFWDPVQKRCTCTRFGYYDSRCRTPCEKCKKGKRQGGGCEGNTPVVCVECSSCPAGFSYATGGCDGTRQDTVCTACTGCPKGTYAQGGCRAGADTFCQTCTPCPEGYFAADGCDGVVDSNCQECSTCRPGTFPVKPCDQFNDVQCASCQGCPDGTEEVEACTETKPPVCIGLVTYLPNFPLAQIGVETQTLLIELGMAAPDGGLSIELSAKGIEVRQNGQSNFDGSGDFADKVQTGTVVVDHGKFKAPFSVVAHAHGPNPVTFKLVGPSASKYKSVQGEERLLFGLFADPGGQTVWDKFNVPFETFPFGDEVKTAAAGLQFSSTHPWIVVPGSNSGKYVTCGAVAVKRPDMTDAIPVAVKGIVLTLTPVNVDFDNDALCAGVDEANKLSEAHQQQLATTSSLVRSWFNSMDAPSWLQVKADPSGITASMSPFDMSSYILSGDQVKAIGECAPLPARPSELYAVILWSKSSFIVVDDEQATVGAGNPLCLAIGISRPADPLLINMPAAAWSNFNGLSFKKKLDDSGWIINRISLGLSYSGSIVYDKIFPSYQLWNGENFFSPPAANANMWLRVAVSKTLLDVGSKNAGLSIKFDFEGQVGIALKTLQPFDDMFNNRWDAFMEADAKLQFIFKLLGKEAKWDINAQAVVLASMDGVSDDRPARLDCGLEGGVPKGVFLYFRLDFRSTAFGKAILDGPLAPFLLLGKSYEIDTYVMSLYESVQENGKWVDKPAGFGIKLHRLPITICYFPGICHKITLDIQYLKTSVLGMCDDYDRKDEVYGSLPEGYALAITGQSAGPLMITPFIALDVGASARLVFTVEKFSMLAHLQFRANLLGANVNANLVLKTYPEPSMLASFDMKIYDRFDVDVDLTVVIPLNIMSIIMPWATIEWEFSIALRGDFFKMLQEFVIRLIEKAANWVRERIDEAERYVLGIIDQIERALRVIEQLKKAFEAAERALDQARAFLDSVQGRLNDAKETFKRFEREVDEFQRKFDTICRIRECGHICIPGCELRSRRRRRRASHAIDLLEMMPKIESTRTRRALARPRASSLLRRRRFGKKSWPRLVCSSCMWKVPDIPCHIANAICRAIRIPIMIIIKIVKAAIAVALEIIKAIEALVAAARAIVEAAAFIVQIAAKIVDAAMIVFKILDIARAVAQAAFDAVRAVLAAAEAAAKAFFEAIIGSIASVFNVRGAFFFFRAKGIIPREFAVGLEVSIYKGPWTDLSIRVNFADIFESISRAASDLFGRFFGGLFRRRRTLGAHVEIDVDHTMQLAEKLGVPLHNVFWHEALSPSHRGMYDLDIDTALVIRERQIQEKEMYRTHPEMQARRARREAVAPVEEVDRTIAFAHKCDVFTEYSDFLFGVTEEIEIRVTEAINFKESVNKSRDANFTLDDPVQYAPTFDKRAFADDPVVDGLVVNYFDNELDLEAVAQNATHDDEVTASEDQVNAGETDNDRTINTTETQEYQNLLAELSNDFGESGALEPLGCEDTTDCILTAIQHIVDQFSDVVLPEEHQDVQALLDEVENATRILINGTSTLTEADEAVAIVVQTLTDILERDLLCGSAPNITKQPIELATVLPASAVTISCNATGSPEPKFAWWKGDKKVGEGPTLTIDPVNPDDDGNYRCLAYNHIDEAWSNISQILVLGSASSEMLITYRFPLDNFTAFVGNKTYEFGVALQQAVATAINVDFTRIGSVAVDEQGQVSHSILVRPEGFEFEATQEEAITRLRLLCRWGDLDVRFENNTITAIPASFRRDYCRVPCLTVGTSEKYGEPCVPTQMTCPLGAGSCRFECPSQPYEYIFQAGAAASCRTSHQLSGYDQTTYCRRINDPPYEITYTGKTSFDENAKDLWLGRLRAKDTDPTQTLSYSLVATGDHTSFRIDAMSGNVTLASPFNYEAKKTATIVVRVTDDFADPFYADKLFTFQVLPVNEVPTAISFNAFGSPVIEMATIGRVVGTLSTTDPDKDDTFTYKVESTPAGWLGLKNGNQVVVTGAIDYESIEGHQIELHVTSTDAGGLWTDAWFTVDIADKNEPPLIEFSCAFTKCLGIYENTTDKGKVLGSVVVSDVDIGQTYTVSMTQQPEGFFKVSGMDLLFDGVFDEAAPRDLLVTLRVTDSGTPSLTSNIVDLHFVNNDVKTTTTSATTATTATTTTTTTATTTTSTSATTTTTEFVNTTTTPVTTTSITAAKTTTTATTRTTTTATTSTSSATTTSTTTSATVTTTFFNVAPTDLALSNKKIKENSARGTVIGRFSVTDSPQQKITYTLANDFEGRFLISNDYLVVGDGATIDFELQRSYTLAVTATDDGTPPKSTSASFTITVENVNEKPSIECTCARSNTTKGCLTLFWGDKADTEVCVPKAVDPDKGQSHQYFLEETEWFRWFSGAVQLKKDIEQSSPSKLSFKLHIKDNGAPPITEAYDFAVTTGQYTSGDGTTVASLGGSSSSNIPIIVGGVVLGLLVVAGIGTLVYMRRTHKARLIRVDQEAQARNPLFLFQQNQFEEFPL